MAKRFHSHLRAMLRANHHRANVPVTAERVHAAAAAEILRPDEAKMTTAQQKAFVHAVQSLLSSGVYATLVADHRNMKHDMHSGMDAAGTQRFLPWHRIFLVEFEAALRAVDATVTVPYWDWAANPRFPAWLDEVRPTVELAADDGGPHETIHVTRHPGSQTEMPNQGLPTPQNVDAMMAAKHFTDFTRPQTKNGALVSPFGLEGIHNTVHEWVGGTMDDVQHSPSDPVFWLHHANIDRLWAQWQTKHDGEHPALEGNKLVMDPWTNYTEVDTRTTAGLGYRYS